MAKVFISYKSERRPAASYLARVLSAYGYDVWFDYGLLPGADFQAQLDARLAEADAVIVLWCSMAVASPWVQREAETAKRAAKFIPNWIEPASLPENFARDHTLNLADWDGAPRSHQLDPLLAALARMTGAAPVMDFDTLSALDRVWRDLGAPSLRAFALGEAVKPGEERARTASGRSSGSGDGLPELLSEETIFETTADEAGGPIRYLSYDHAKNEWIYVAGSMWRRCSPAGVLEEKAFEGQDACPTNVPHAGLAKRAGRLCLWDFRSGQTIGSFIKDGWTWPPTSVGVYSHDLELGVRIPGPGSEAATVFRTSDGQDIAKVVNIGTYKWLWGFAGRTLYISASEPGLHASGCTLRTYRPRGQLILKPELQKWAQDGSVYIEGFEDHWDADAVIWRDENSAIVAGSSAAPSNTGKIHQINLKSLNIRLWEFQFYGGQFALSECRQYLLSGGYLDAHTEGKRCFRMADGKQLSQFGELTRARLTLLHGGAVFLDTEQDPGAPATYGAGVSALRSTQTGEVLARLSGRWPLERNHTKSHALGRILTCVGENGAYARIVRLNWSADLPDLGARVVGKAPF